MNKIIIIICILFYSSIVHCPGYIYYPDIAIDLTFEKDVPIPHKVSRKRITRKK